MKEKLPYWGSLILSSVAVVLLIANVSLSNNNRVMQMEVSQRQNMINSGQTLGQLNQSLVQAMAEASIKNNDTPMRDLLTSQGITLKSDAPAPTNSAATPAAKSTGKK